MGLFKKKTPERDQGGRIPLHYAAADQKPGEVAKLLAEGQDPNDRDLDGHTPLHLAAQYDNTEILRMLLDAGAEVNARNNKGETPLHRAVRSNWSSKEAIAVLRAAGADPYAAPDTGRSPLAHVQWIDSPAWKKEAFADLIDQPDAGPS